jgi:hypothetical protein
VSTILFIILWVGIGLTLFTLALFGGVRGTRERVLQTQTRRGRRLMLVVLTVAYVGFGILIPTVVVANNEEGVPTPTGMELNDDQRNGRELFGQWCSQCHVLKSANAVGRVGPNLDVLRPPRSLVLNAIQQGRAQGNGRMPAELLQGQDAQDVADFVAATAGQE